MLLKKITLTNIYTFFGEQSLTLPTEGESKLIVILARNSSGKTSLIRALRLLFYGFDSKEEARRCVNLEAIRQAKKSELVEARIRATFSIGKRTYTIIRSITVQKTETPPPDYFETKVLFVSHENDRDVKQADPEMVHGHMTEMLPESLFDFFFFKGEELAHRLLETKDADITNGLSEVLYREKWKSATESLAAAVKSFSKDASVVQGQSKEYQNLNLKKERLVSKQDEFKVQLLKVEQEEIRLRKQYDDLDAEYISASSSSSLQVKDKRAAKVRERDTLQRLISSLEAQLKKEVGSSGGIYFIGKAFPPAQKVLAWMREKGLLPPDISQTFINGLLDKGECICGEDLKGNPNRREHVERFRSDSVAAALSHDLYTLLSRIEIGFPSKLKQRSVSVVENAKKLDAEVDKLAHVEEDIRAIERQYDEKAEESVRLLKVKRDRARTDHEKLLSEKANIQGELKIVNNDLLDILREIGEIAHVPNAALDLLAGEAVGMRLKELAEQCEREMQRSFRTYLQEHTAKLYSEVVVDGSEAFIEPNSLLPVIRRAGAVGYVAGGGQQQVLVLAYIAALSQLRKRINADMRKYFYLNEVTEQCFFMDSVFAPMENAYREKVCAAIPGKMRQLVLLLAPQQWDDAVSSGLEKHIDKAFSLEIQTNKIEDKEAQGIIFKKKRVALATIVKEKIEPYTVIKVLEV